MKDLIDGTKEDLSYLNIAGIKSKGGVALIHVIGYTYHSFFTSAHAQRIFYTEDYEEAKVFFNTWDGKVSGWPEKDKRVKQLKA